VREFAPVLHSYRVRHVVGDRYGGAWPKAAFANYGIEYRPAVKVKSEIYLALLPFINSRRCDLLDNQRTVSQLCALERSCGRNRDAVDHRRGVHDDMANCIAGAIDLLMARSADRLLLHDPIGLAPRLDAGLIDTVNNPVLGDAAAVAAAGPLVDPALHSPWEQINRETGMGGVISLAHLGLP
jgi:hypothetical protein